MSLDPNNFMVPLTYRPQESNSKDSKDPKSSRSA